MKENYMPSEAEVNKAEGMMTETQKELTEDREKMFTELEKMGKTGYLESSDVPNSDKDSRILSEKALKGIINGHLVRIKIKEKRSYEGSIPKNCCVADGAWIDDEPISSEQANEIFNKFKDVAINSQKIYNANREVNEESKEFEEMEKERVSNMVNEILS